MNLFVVAALTFLMSQHSNAQTLVNPNCTVTMQRQALEEINAIEAQGWREVSGLKLAEIKKMILSKSYWIDCDPTAIVVEEDRQTAFNFADQGIHLNMINFEKHQKETQNLILIHEILGVHKVDDRKFQVTGPLSLMRETKFTKDSLLNTLPKTAKKGGSDGVGGGGDGIELEIKRDIARELLPLYSKLGKNAALYANELFQVRVRLLRSGKSKLATVRLVLDRNGFKEVEVGIGHSFTNNGFWELALAVNKAVLYNVFQRQGL